MRAYNINEIFYSIQGEGDRVGTPCVFVRFMRCNMRCTTEAGPSSPGGFDCDTEFESGYEMTMGDICEMIERQAPHCKSVVLTGGEPALQVDRTFVDALHTAGKYVAIETNGSIGLGRELAEVIDFVTVSPKVAEHAIKQRWANEVKYVRGHGQAIPHTTVEAAHRFIVPASDGLELDPAAIAWCVALVKEHPEWRLLPQLHKAWGVR